MENKIMTFNLRVDIPQDGPNAWANRVEAAAKVILDHQPLVVGTQEGKLHMLKDLDKQLPKYSWVGEGRRGGLEDEFCAIFYNTQLLECIETGQFWLSEQPEVANSVSWNSSLPRICTWGYFRFRQNPDKEFIVYNTHLDHISQEARENGIALIWERLNQQYKSKNVPILLTGDFNSEPDNLVIQFLRGLAMINNQTVHMQDVYKKLNEEPGRTFHNFKGGHTGEPIDYIFCTQDIAVVKAEVDRNRIGDVYPSDHYPVVMTFRLT